MEKNSQNFSMEEAMKMANSPAAQQLIAMLRNTNGDQLQKAMALASAGDMKSASQIINGLLSGSPQAKKLAEELGR
ncbi:MAG: hypothetical protein IKK41_01315 [Oscillospiraceae bacterium]|nr:hypothetical protein [Oscillospiraceae bacterium]